MSGPAANDPPALRSARWMAWLTVALLASAIGSTLLAAAPALLRAAGVELPSTPPPLAAAPLAMPHRPPSILAHPDLPGALFDPDRDGDSDDAQIDEPDLQSPHGVHANVPSAPDAPDARLAFTRGPLTLREQPAPVASVVGEVKRGERVSVLHVAGAWALVRYDGGDGFLIGWVKKSEIAIR